MLGERMASVAADSIPAVPHRCQLRVGRKAEEGSLPKENCVRVNFGLKQGGTKGPTRA